MGKCLEIRPETNITSHKSQIHPIACHGGNEIFFINIVVKKFQEVIRSKFGRAASVLGVVLDFEDRASERIATRLISKVPRIVDDLGINILLTPLYINGSTVIIKGQIQSIDHSKIVHRNKGLDIGILYDAFMSALDYLRLEIGLEVVNNEIFFKAKSKLMDKLKKVIHEKILEKAGLDTDVFVIEDKNEEVEW
eukprot:CAMPEP_0113310082 /NCGR_PEP_ID=MMETSP0010_2-20120614/7867_1 /TAXON_ID=216773 ORGANISM="Corethron hystrix, Strain 308" /NCGR_SAMPLE_ID=MMETSP0010_2 /ASSEMBLY_ACC=CAM_ASM_000155 /LENGTH=193 /DNA_ID=CAMNT_0000165461 /DNA_START=42 /DNA_END=620 /DNA_ORIENTATION=+ /assembly_acc=CAM_ASM_000155